MGQPRQDFGAFSGKVGTGLPQKMRPAWNQGAFGHKFDPVMAERALEERSDHT
jgi:hypothetical protein